MADPFTNLMLSAAVFAVLLFVFRYFFASSTFPGAPVAPSSHSPKPSNLTEVSSEQTFKKLIAGPGLAVVDFTASWCGPCQMIAPTFQQLAVDNAQVQFLKVDVDANPTIAKSQEVTAMPTFVFFKGGKRVESLRGANAGELKRLVQQWK